MVRTIISTFAVCALMAITADSLVERAFAPKKKAINLAGIISILGTAPRGSFAPDLIATDLIATDLIANVETKNVSEALMEDDFIPSFEEEASSAGVASQSKEIVFPSKIAKSNLGELSEAELIAENSGKDPEGMEKGFPKKFKEAKPSIGINGAEPVSHFGFKSVRGIKPSSLVANFKPIHVKETIVANHIGSEKISVPNENKHNEQHLEKDKSSQSLDRISTALAANEKSGNKLLLQSDKKKNISRVEKLNKKRLNEELVFFDYSKTNSAAQKVEEFETKGTSIAAKIKAKPITSPIAQTQSFSSKNQAKPKNQILGEILKKMGKDFERSKAHKVTKVGSKTEGKSSALASETFAKKVNSQNHKSTYRLTTQSRSLLGKNYGMVRDFEIRFADDIDDIRRANSDGALVIKELLNSDYGVRRGTIYASGHYPTTVDFVFEGQDVNLGMPLVTEDSFNEVLRRKGLRGLGGHVLVELDQLTEDVEFDLDTNYEAKLFLDGRMRVVERSESDYSFILFVGIEPGNKIISFKTYKNEVTSKIVHVSQDEIYYDFNFYTRVENDEFSLFEEHLLSKETGLLSVDENEISDLAYDTRFFKKTVNKMSAKRALYPVGTRKYYELKHLKEPIFVGRWSSKYIDVPSESYIRFAMQNFRGYSLENSCMVQINLEKQAKELSYNGQSFRGHMRITPRILDTDGIFYRDLSHQSKRIFLLGEEQGIVSVRIEYVDNSVDYLQTFCSKSNYVVEQL